MTRSSLAHAQGKPRQNLLRWYRKFGRHLPWRQNPEPWAVLISEFLLQQTTVAAVIPRFETWMRKFPTPHHMARAQQSEVLELWQGLGYYRRASLLHRTAQILVAEHGGQVPQDFEELQRLPGLGPYTAAAVAAFAFDCPVPVLDANILRVGARLGDVQVPVETAAGRARVEETIRRLLPARRGGRDIASALMDLGALICRPRAPRCSECPLRFICQAKNPESLPIKKSRPALRHLVNWRAWIQGKRGVALVPSPGPWWKGLWLLPPAGPEGEPILTLRYAVTCHRVEMRVVRQQRLPPGAKWFSLENLPPMASPHRKALFKLLTLENSCPGISRVNLRAPEPAKEAEGTPRF